jgi:hypothetical protein
MPLRSTVHRILVTSLVLTLAAAPVRAQNDEPARETLVVGQFERIPLPSLDPEVDYPYTILLPRGWVTNRDFPEVGVLLGPEGATPTTHPEMILVRQSPAEVSDPATLAETIRANADQLPWTPGQLEVVELGDVSALWVRMDVDDPQAPRRTVALKLPLEEGGSLDVMGSTPAASYPRMARHYQRLILSILPEGAEEAGDEGDMTVEDVEVMEKEPSESDEGGQ